MNVQRPNENGVGGGGNTKLHDSWQSGFPIKNICGFGFLMLSGSRPFLETLLASKF